MAAYWCCRIPAVGFRWRMDGEQRGGSKRTRKLRTFRKALTCPSERTIRARQAAPLTRRRAEPDTAWGVVRAEVNPRAKAGGYRRGFAEKIVKTTVISTWLEDIPSANAVDVAESKGLAGPSCDD